MRPRRRIRTLVLAAATVAILGLIAVALPARFIGEHCFSVRVQPRDRPADIVQATAGVPGYLRDTAPTFLTLPSWYVVYSAEEYAAFVKSHAPSRFPYFAAIRQYWRYYASSCGGTRRVYPFDPRAHLILGLTGLGFTLDNAVKGATRTRSAWSARASASTTPRRTCSRARRRVSTPSSCAPYRGTTFRSPRGWRR